MKVRFEAKDGKLFDTEIEAVAHEAGLEKSVQEKLDKFLQGYSGKGLLEKHYLADTGVWEVRGEDPNCDLGGYHHQPSLGLVSGHLSDAIRWAVQQPSFYSWGGGGDIIKRSVTQL